MSNRLLAFEKLYDENKDKLQMPKDSNYPMNYKVGMKWANHHCDDESSRFASQIIQHTAYVSYMEFIDQLDNVCKSFKKFYKDVDAEFILIVPFTVNKSNFWVSLLAFPSLRDMISDVQNDITCAYNKYVIGKKSKNVVCIICDDCAYTGNQIASYCSLDPHRILYDGKPDEPPDTSIEWINWLKGVTNHTTNLEKTIDKAKFSVNLLVPFMSTMAQQVITERSFVMISRSAKIFKLFREHVDMSEFNQNVIREFESSFQYHTNISAIYFDHKIADAVSTFNKVFLLAPVFNCGTLRKSVCFIQGCCNARPVDDNINIYDVYINMEDHITKACPPTFYKSIVYTNNGVKIKNTESTLVYDLVS